MLLFINPLSDLNLGRVRLDPEVGREKLPVFFQLFSEPCHLAGTFSVRLLPEQAAQNDKGLCNGLCVYTPSVASAPSPPA